jgi:hypothetical protein
MPTSTGDTAEAILAPLTPDGLAPGVALTLGEHKLLVALCEITPELAGEWLEQNTRNRSPKKDAIQNHVDSIKSGDWVLNGQPIIFDSEDVLADGQNRLHAIRKAGVTVVSLVVWGVEPVRAQDTQDTGTKRSVADQLTIHGYAHAKDLAAILAPLRVIRQIRDWPMGSQSRLTVPQALRMMEDFPNYEALVKEAISMRSACRLPASVAGTLMVLFNEVDPEDSAAFWECVRTGGGLDPKSPILKLRERLMADAALPTGAVRIGARQKAALTIKAWNAWRAGETPTFLRWRSGGATAEPFPAWDVAVP